MCMRTIIQLSSDSRGIILMLLFFLLLVQLFEFLLAVFLHIYGRHVMEEGLFAVTLLGFVLVCSGHLSTVSGARFWRYEEQISHIPAIFLDNPGRTGQNRPPGRRGISSPCGNTRPA